MATGSGEGRVGDRSAAGVPASGHQTAGPAPCMLTPTESVASTSPTSAVCDRGTRRSAPTDAEQEETARAVARKVSLEPRLPPLAGTPEVKVPGGGGHRAAAESQQGSGQRTAASDNQTRGNASGQQTAGSPQPTGKAMPSDAALDALLRFQEELNESQRRVRLLEQRMQLMADDSGRVQAAERSLATAVGERDRQMVTMRAENDARAMKLRYELNEMQSVAEQHAATSNAAQQHIAQQDVALRTALDQYQQQVGSQIAHQQAGEQESIYVVQRKAMEFEREVGRELAVLRERITTQNRTIRQLESNAQGQQLCIRNEASQEMNAEVAIER